MALVHGRLAPVLHHFAYRSESLAFRNRQTHHPASTQSASGGYAADAPNADLPKAQHQQAEEGSQDLSLSAGRAAGQSPRPRLVCRHHLSAMRRGFLYLVAIMDWFKRKVLAWRISNTLEVNLCIKALNEALHRFGAPEIMNTDHGSQFTSFAWTDRLIRAVPGSRWTARGAASTTSSWRACGGP